MNLIKKMRKQFAIYWERTGNSRTGSALFAEPVQIRCRWDDKQEEFVDTSGATRASKAVVYPDRTMRAGDMLKLGELDSLTPDDPKGDADAMAVQSFERIPNLKATKILFVAHL